ncbi:hypothetical protein ALC60_03376 [Trachymyrmex zeteki]|uniref:Uncharacterized protein n=1 Tax=Mycetomoellerius zeteki TaxID=64791 RepID=A0A151XAM0_9HYME|nr:hypothetical protein ALC60_03376 [Trachymyrmex zeteki]
MAEDRTLLGFIGRRYARSRGDIMNDNERKRQDSYVRLLDAKEEGEGDKFHGISNTCQLPRMTSQSLGREIIQFVCIFMD